MVTIHFNRGAAFGPPGGGSRGSAAGTRGAGTAARPPRGSARGAEARVDGMPPSVSWEDFQTCRASL